MVVTSSSVIIRGPPGPPGEGHEVDALERRKLGGQTGRTARPFAALGGVGGDGYQRGARRPNSAKILQPVTGLRDGDDRPAPIPASGSDGVDVGRVALMTSWLASCPAWYPMPLRQLAVDAAMPMAGTVDDPVLRRHRTPPVHHFRRAVNTKAIDSSRSIIAPQTRGSSAWVRPRP